MGRKTTAAVVVGILLLPAFTALGGERVSVRQVEVSNKAEYMDAKLDDVRSLLADNLPFKSFTLLQDWTVVLPADATLAAARGRYTIILAGPQDSLRITVTRRKDVLYDGTVALRDGTPLSVGGFPSGKGKVIFVLVVR